MKPVGVKNGNYLPYKIGKKVKRKKRLTRYWKRASKNKENNEHI